MRKYIDLFEGLVSDSTKDQIAAAILNGDDEGFSPYWKLHASSKIIHDAGAMSLISELVGTGETSGHGPDWKLTMTDGEPAPAEIDEDDIPTIDPVDVPETPDLDHEEMLDQLGDISDEIESLTHKVVAVCQKYAHEGDQDWYEAEDHEATKFVVEDGAGSPVDWHEDRNSAEAHAHALNNPMVLDEVDEVAPNPCEDMEDIELQLQAALGDGESAEHARNEMSRRPHLSGRLSYNDMFPEA